ncbi:hypothetical protein [Gudongella sp. DL1XJH-153]|uniref:hypothetical protein n=1 Tax=Gudongella sp. DL1XJH-153 TaxID=3409804 RepID=UPI003BB49E3D
MRKQKIIIGLLLVLSLSFGGCSQDTPVDSETEGLEAENPEIVDESHEPIVEEPEVEQQESLLSAPYADIMMGNQYTMKYKTITQVEGQEYEATITTVIDGENFATVFESELANSTTIQMDGKLYMVMHDQKMVMVFPEDTDQASEFNETESDIVDTEGMTFTQSGTAEFMGETRKFEEYNLEDGSIRYYFDGESLVGMEMTGEGYNSKWLIEDFSDSVDMSLFSIPDDYTIYEP